MINLIHNYSFLIASNIYVIENQYLVICNLSHSAAIKNSQSSFHHNKSTLTSKSFSGKQKKTNIEI